VRQTEQELAGQKLIEAEARVTSLDQTVAQAARERETLGYDAQRHEVMKRVVAHMRDHAVARQTAEEKYQALTQVRYALDELARSIAEQEQQVASARDAYRKRAAALQAEIATGGDIAVLTEQLAAARRWKELQQEHTHLTTQQQVLSPQLDSVRRSLASFVQQEAMKEQELRELTQQRDRVRDEEQEKARLELEARHLGKELQEAVREEKRVMAEADAARIAWQRASLEAQKQQEAVVGVEQQEQTALTALEESRRQHEIAHVRAALQVGDSCPVCHSSVHALPPLSLEAEADLSSSQQAVDAAKAALTQARQTSQSAQAALAAARTRQETAVQAVAERAQKRQEAQERFVARFPKFPALSAALSTLQTQRQELAAQFQELEISTQAAEKEKQVLSRQREKAQQEEARVAETLRGLAVILDQRKQQLTSLAQALAPYLSSTEDPETTLTARRHALLRADQEVQTLERQHRRAAEVLTSLTTGKLQKEGDFGVLTSQHAGAMAQVEREAQAVREGLNLSTDTPFPELAALESELSAFAQKQAQYSQLLQREESLHREQERAGRQTAALQADLQARERELGRSRQERVAAEQDFERVRAELRVAVQQSGLSDVDPRGEGVRERLAVVHERAIACRDRRSRLDAEILDLERRCTEKEQEQEKLRAAETEGRLATDLHKLLGAEFTDFLSQGAVEALMRDATVHLQRLTHGRYAFDIAYKRRTIELQIVDHEDMKRARPTHSLSGGETFLASLAIALALSQGFREVATGKAATTSTECLILDEGFGTLDREGLQLVTETLQELRGEEGRMVGIITHVEEVAAAMPMRIAVRKESRTSTIQVSG
jgi:exonuclease SbcC